MELSKIKNWVKFLKLTYFMHSDLEIFYWLRLDESRILAMNVKNAKVYKYVYVFVFSSNHFE